MTPAGFTIDLRGRRALVTGAGRGIGRSIALTLASAGATVAVNDIVPEQVDAVVEEISSTGGKAAALPFDVTDWDAVARSVVRYGDIDLLVNNAGNAGAEGFSPLVDFAESDPSSWGRFFAVNLFGAMHCTRAVLPSMIAEGHGRVVTIVSEAGRFGDSKLAPYAAAKAGAAGFCRSVAREVGRYGITVNCISLGTMESPITSGAREVNDRRYVIRRRGRPDEVAGLVTYLASPLADWITGQTYGLNGGYTFSL